MNDVLKILERVRRTLRNASTHTKRLNLSSAEAWDLSESVELAMIRLSQPETLTSQGEESKVQNMDHECRIGLLDRDWVLNQFERKPGSDGMTITDVIEFVPAFKPQSFSDFRNSHVVSRFRYCPDCGEEINWKLIKSKIRKRWGT